MKHWSELNEKDKSLLLRYPAYIALLAAASGEGIDEHEKNAALKLIHIRTFATDALLFDFYRAVEKEFDKDITELDHSLAHNRKERKASIEMELSGLDSIINQLDPAYALVLRRSMEAYKNYVSRAHRNVLEYFIFPLPINGITD